jgi:drug/metabolite transporter (DMT)-like permease
MLMLVTALWGMSFPLMETWMAASRDCPGGVSLASLTLIALRMFLALLVLALLRPSLFRAPNRRELQCGAIIGASFFGGFALQVCGLASTTPAVSAFITSLGSAWVPLLAWAWFRAAIPGLTYFGLGLGILGTFVLTLGKGVDYSWGSGETLTFLASLFFAVQILVIDRLGRTVNSAHLTVPFLAATGGLALLLALINAAQTGFFAWLAWTANILSDGAILRGLAVLTLACTVVAFHWMNVYQPRVTAERAALIYLMEPLFGAAFSIAWEHESLTAYLIVGGVLILAGNLLVELPSWLATRLQEPVTPEP